jgi:hypothetical protein
VSDDARGNSVDDNRLAQKLENLRPLSKAGPSCRGKDRILRLRSARQGVLRLTKVAIASGVDELHTRRELFPAPLALARRALESAGARERRVAPACGCGRQRGKQSSNSMLYRIGISLRILIGLGLLWPSKVRAVFGLAGIIAALATIGWCARTALLRRARLR